jgi:hypothetical protein|eukprot:m.391131 g.391131  ORF g.391131 m.391131 type:complete len:88 (+) comp28311_c0_seq1:97-360(+)
MVFDSGHGHKQPRFFLAQIDIRDQSAFSERTTGEGYSNPMIDKAMERTEKLNEMAERSAEMAKHGEDFSDSAGELVDYYKNRKWWQL